MLKINLFGKSFRIYEEKELEEARKEAIKLRFSSVDLGFYLERIPDWKNEIMLKEWIDKMAAVNTEAKERAENLTNILL